MVFENGHLVTYEEKGLNGLHSLVPLCVGVKVRSPLSVWLAPKAQVSRLPIASATIWGT